MPDVCPTCGEEVVLTALQNLRNDRWTVLPLDLAHEDGVPADFILTDAQHEAEDILGTVVGVFPVAEPAPPRTAGTHRTHPPSHYLEAPQ